jgi:DNA-binding NarL/FixJ family response regulator
MNELATSLDLRTEFTVNESELKTLASSHPRLVVLDLAAEEYDAISIAKALKKQSAHPIILGFYPHVRRDLEAAAKSAGVDIVVPNSNLLTVVRRVLEKEADKD